MEKTDHLMHKTLKQLLDHPDMTVRITARLILQDLMQYEERTREHKKKHNGH